MNDVDPLASLLGSSPTFDEVKVRARQVLARAASGGRLPPILIQGETGSGKGLLARALHLAGPRAAGPFVAVNCGAIPETLGESEFFGFARGAHSEARQAKTGLFQAADRGMIFLDEVGLLSEGHQARLLKVVEDRQVTPVGSTRPVPVDVWVVSATNADLRADVQTKRFRRDLYERLAVLTFTLPPLRERRDDIVALAEQFLLRTCREYGLRPKTLAPDAQRRLLEHTWPGNIRELANVIERAALLVETDTIAAARLELVTPTISFAPSSSVRPAAVRSNTRRERVIEALERHEANITRAAGYLGITRKTLRDWMKQEGLYSQRQSQDSGLTVESAGGGHATPAHSDRVDNTGSDESLAERMGMRLASSPPLPSTGPADGSTIHWERRRITMMRVIFSAENDERVRDMVKPLEIAAQKVEAFGGRVIELSRNGLDSAFGLDPLDDATQRAAYAALAIQRAGARAREQSSAIPTSRVALHADSYLVGRMGASIQIAQEAKQVAVARLAALIEVAGPDTAIASQAILQLLRRRFDFEGPMEGAGAGAVYRLIGRAERPALFDRQISFFVGRDAELALLRNRWDLAMRGHGQIVGIVGSPGVGKSRLAWEFLHDGPSRQGLILETASVVLGRPTPYAAIIDLLRSYFGIDAGEDEVSIRDKVTRRVADLDQALVASLPAFLSLFDVATGDSAWEALDPARRRKRTFDSIKRLMLRESARKPLLLVFEDAHWADAETKALLETVTDSLPAARVLVLATFRPEYEHGWRRHTFYTQLRIDPLGGDALERFLSDLLGDHPSLSELRTRLIQWTDGNPFFLEETVWTLVETGALEGKRGGYQMARPVTAIAVPDTVHEVLAARMARLTPSAHQLVQCAAVIGRRVPHALLAVTSTLTDDDLRANLEVLREREFMLEDLLADEREYTFRHALTQEVAYASLPDHRHRALHVQVLDGMERLYADRMDDKVAELAHHAFEGQQWERAVNFLRRAGARAFARSANTEAAACYEQAMVALSHLPQSRENVELAIDLRFDLRNALTPLAQAHRVLAHLREAERLAAEVGDERRRARALSFAANSLCLTAEYEQAVEASEQARELAERLGNFSLSVAAGMYLGRANAGRGEYRRAAQVLREVVQSLGGQRMLDYLGLPVLPSVFARSQLVLALAELGEFDEAERVIADAVEIAEGIRHPDTLLWAYAGAGMARLVRGHVSSATSALERALELCRTADMPVYVPLVGSPLGLAYAMGGRVADGLALAEQAVEQAEARRQVALLAWTLLRLGEVLCASGRPDAASAPTTRALSLFREHSERGGEGYALRVLGEARGSTGDAENLLVQASSLAHHIGMRPLAARAQLSLALHRASSGLSVDDGSHLEDSVRAFKELDMHHWMTVADDARRKRA